MMTKQPLAIHFENLFDQVLQAGKPPFPCLKRTKIDNNLGSMEDLFCAFCLIPSHRI
jgi:hypothetical protein